MLTEGRFDVEVLSERQRQQAAADEIARVTGRKCTIADDDFIFRTDPTSTLPDIARDLERFDVQTDSTTEQ